MKGIIGLKNILGSPVLSDAIYLINFYKSLKGLSKIRDFTQLLALEP